MNKHGVLLTILNLTLLEKIRKAIVVMPKYNEFYDLRILEPIEALLS